jgi:hypothetical protein
VRCRQKWKSNCDKPSGLMKIRRDGEGEKNELLFVEFNAAYLIINFIVEWNQHAQDGSKPVMLVQLWFYCLQLNIMGLLAK